MKKLLGATLVSVLLLLACQAAAQEPDSLVRRYEIYTGLCQSEKLFLHLDRAYYAAGETIWFNAYLEDASGRQDRPMSNFIYVELLDSEGKVCRRVKIKRTEEGFPGCLVVPDDIKGGDYSLRAYTLWQTSRPAEYMFHQSLKIVGPYGEAPAAARVYPEGLDVSFYPEGGRYFAGHRARIGFKAMDPSGRSVDISGLVVDAEGNIVASAVTRHDGMGVISLIAEPGKQYFLATNSGARFQLPAPSTEGATLNVARVEDSILIKAMGEGHYALYSRDMSGLSRLADVNLSGGAVSFRLKMPEMLSGINHFLLVSESGEIVSERLFFVYDDSPVRCSIECPQQGAWSRSHIKAGVTVTDTLGGIQGGRFSVSIVRGSLRSRTQDDNLLSYMNLSSELAGTLNNPRYYFDPEIPLHERELAMNLLMMIQGWRYYDMPALMSRGGVSVNLGEEKEMHQKVRGRIDRRNSDKMPKDFFFNLLIPSKKYMTSIFAPEGNRFVIDSLDFEENTEFLINIGRSKVGSSFIPKWSGDQFAEEFKYSPAPGFVVGEQITENIPLVSEIMAADTLSAAKIVAESYSDIWLLNGVSVSKTDLEIYKDRTLIEYMNIKAPSLIYDGEQMYNSRIISAMPVAESEDSEESSDDGQLPYPPVKLVVNETEESWYVYDQVRVEEIEAISISTLSDSYYNSEGGVVSIRFKKDLPSSSLIPTNPDLIYFVPLGYSKPSKFYSPRYDLGENNEVLDCRNTVYWNPCVVLSDGKADIDFCTTDQEDYPYYVRVEGKTADGRFFSGSNVLNFKSQ